MLEQQAQQISQFLLQNPHWGGIITFFIAFSESLAVIGSIIPGSVTMTAVGVLIGTNILPLGSTFLWAILGALSGDILSYWVGHHYNERLRNMWPFHKNPQWLLAGENFFKKHGGKSIFIGRFIGPVRSVIPLIAGVLQMHWKRFILAAIPASILWAFAYMLPGILLGALALQLPPGMATKFILLLFLVIIVLSVVAWLIRNIFYKIRIRSDLLIQRAWISLSKKPRYSYFTRLISDANNVENHHQFSLLISAIFLLGFFLLVFTSLMLHQYLFNWNQPTFEFLRSLRHTLGDKIMIAITFLGAGKVLIPPGFVMVLWFCWCKKWRTALHLFIALIGAVCIPQILKHLIYSPRPHGLLRGPTTNSFPSGHTFLASVYFGFFSALFATYCKKNFRTLFIYLAAAAITLVGFSRLYLGVHWLTDVLASVFLGLSFISLVTISYRRVREDNFPLWSSVMAWVLLTMMSWGIYTATHLQTALIDHTPFWPTEIIQKDKWWGQQHSVFPTFLTNRLGKPVEPINIQWAGEPEKINELLLEKGWKKEDPAKNLTETLLKIANISKYPRMLTHHLYQNKPPTFIFIKQNDDKSFLVLRLWESQVYLNENNDEPILIGTLSTYVRSKHKKSFVKDKSYSPQKLLDFLDTSKWLIVKLPAQEVTTIRKLQWQGDILQIQS